MAREHFLDVVRIVVLAGDEQDIPAAAGDREFAVDDHAEVAGIEPAVGGERCSPSARDRGSSRAHVVAADLDAPDMAIRDRRAPGVARSRSSRTVTGVPDANVDDRVPAASARRAGRRSPGPIAPRASATVASFRRSRGKVTARLASAKPVDGEHHVLRQSGWRERREEFAAQVGGDRLSAIER